jgi:superfamily II DNA or RNA helicase
MLGSTIFPLLFNYICTTAKLRNMKSIEKKDKVQKEAISAWKKSGKKGTCEIITGLGKTFIALHALYTMPKNKDVHLFLAETTDRETDLKKDVAKYNEIFGKDVFKDYKLEFYCYQSAYKWKDKEFGLVIADEIHDSLTPSYSAFYRNNSYKAIIGLSATVERGTTYETDRGDIYTKGEILDKIAPVCFKYGLKKARVDKTSRDLDVYVILNKLDDKDKYIKAGSKSKTFFQTEKAAYDYWDKQHKQSFFILDQTLKTLKIRITATKRSNILYNLKSKIPIVRKLVDNLDSKTIVFGNSLDSLLQITPNVVSSRNKEEKNQQIRDSFEKGKIKTIGSFKKLKQGANLDGLDNCIMMSYYSTSKDLIQRIGRLRDNGRKGNIFIILTQGTQEEVWLKKMLEDVQHLNITYCPDVDFVINKLS